EIDLDALEATARAATPGPWEADDNMPFSPELQGIFAPEQRRYVLKVDFGDQPESPADAEHIATFDPPTVLALIARLREAEAVIEAIDAIEPMWPRGMYGCPQDMIGRNQIRAVLARYKTTKTEGNEP